ncbi:hypothetical protein P8452_57252 [Trifolium repens]|nr:hypothetical protein P8452_57252 [Trifolium repens]
MQPTCLIKYHNGFSSTKASPGLHILIHFLPSAASTMVSGKIGMLLTYDLQTFWRLAKHMQGGKLAKQVSLFFWQQWSGGNDTLIGCFILRWLGVVVALPADVMMSYGLMVGSGRNKRIREGFSVVWLTLVWVIWRSRNDWIFNNVPGSVEDAVDQIQRTSWHWYLSKTARDSCLLYEWIWDPGEGKVEF